MKVDAFLAKLSSLGVRLWVQDGRLKYTAPRGVMTAEVLEELKRYKSHIIERLEGVSARATPSSDTQTEHPHDAAARASCWLILRSDEAYSRALSRTAEVFLLKEGQTWLVWRGDWFGGESEPIRQKVIAQGLPFEEALKRGNSYIQWHQGTFGKEAS